MVRDQPWPVTLTTTYTPLRSHFWEASMTISSSREDLAQCPWRSCLVAILLNLATGLSAAASPPADLSVEPITQVGLPTAVVDPGVGAARLMIAQKDGLIWVYDRSTKSVLNTPFLDLSSMVEATQGSNGLLGLAFAPDFGQSGHFFVNYTYDTGQGVVRTRIARYQVSDTDPNRADADSAEILLEIDQDDQRHNGGGLHFGPDGYLFIGMGDGGGIGDPLGRGQDPASLLGKMLRIDVSTAGGIGEDSRSAKGSPEACGLVANYAVPLDNPFVGQDGTCDEIWASGLRNPWRFSFDRKTGDLLIADVGQESWEEVNFQPSSSTGGENYGWNCREGLHPFEPCQDPPSFVDPVIEYAQDGKVNCAITGGYVYRGSVPSLQGDYVYSDFCSGRVWFASSGTGYTPELWTTQLRFVTTFGEDRGGELFAGDRDGVIYRFTSAEQALFADDFESGELGVWTVVSRP